MKETIAFMIAAPGLTIALYIFTRLFEMFLRPNIHPAVKLLCGVTMLCSIITAAAVVVGAGDLANFVERYWRVAPG
jgi:hypothetical protein